MYFNKLSKHTFSVLQNKVLESESKTNKFIKQLRTQKLLIFLQFLFINILKCHLETLRTTTMLSSHILIREAAKKQWPSPSPSPLRASRPHFLGEIFLELHKKFIFFSCQVLTPPPLRGRASKKELFCGFPNVKTIRFHINLAL